MRADLATEITNKILRLMETEGSNWKSPWVGQGLHRQAGNQKPYRGINQVILATAGHSPFWATYKGWQQIGAQVRKGEKSTPIFFWKPYAVRDRETEEEKQIMLARTYSVFSADQADNAPALEIQKRPEIERHAECDRVITETGITIKHGGDKAAYIPSLDHIIMPTPEQFNSRGAYYSTTFHECGHATGAPHRLNRDLKGRFGDHRYSFEELIAESTAALVCCAIGITPEPRKESAQYLNNWMAGLRDDKHAIIRAFSHAQRAADFILKETPEHAPEPARPAAQGPDAPEPGP